MFQFAGGFGSDTIEFHYYGDDCNATWFLATGLWQLDHD